MRTLLTSIGMTKRLKAAVALTVLPALVAAAVHMGVPTVYAVQTAPTTHVYNGRLMSGGNAVTTAHSIRFSYWSSADHISTDTTGTGAINTGAATYAGWQEVHTVTPNSGGYFTVVLGSVTPIPSYQGMSIATMLGLNLQVEVKASAEANTSYELLDTDSTDPAVDRSGILSVPFAANADSVDQREIGTSSGSIVILGSGGVLPVSTVPSGTNAGSFAIDDNDTETDTIALEFGSTLAKKLTYDKLNGLFRFNDDLEVQGNLTVTGFINGVNITSLQSSTGALKAYSGDGLNLKVSGGSYRLRGLVTNYAGGVIALFPNTTQYVYFGSGGLKKSVSSFPVDESFVPVAEVVTSGSGILSLFERRTLQSDDRERDVTLMMNPSFEKASYQGDGGDNIGQLSVSHDNITLKNFYVWTSTRTSIQDYDIILRLPVPDNFVRWKTSATTNPVSLTYRSTSGNAANNKADIQIYDTAGVPVTLSGSTANLVNTSWATTGMELSGSPTWTPGADMLIRIKVYAKDGYQMHIGGLKLEYVTLD